MAAIDTPASTVMKRLSEMLAKAASRGKFSRSGGLEAAGNSPVINRHTFLVGEPGALST